MKETQVRSLVKAFTWRVTGTTSTFFISWCVTKDINIAGTVVGIHFVLNTIEYFIQERIWNSIKWGCQ